MPALTPSQRPLCHCCRRPIDGDGWEILTPTGFLERLCRPCGPHLRMLADGTVTRERPCPDAPPRLRLLR